MPIEVKMAKLSPTMESGKLVKWLVKVGDKINEGDSLAEVETDKATMTMEAFDEGVVASLDVQEGDDIALGQRMLLLAKKGEDPKQVAAASAAAPAAKATPSKNTATSTDHAASGSSAVSRSDSPAPAATATVAPSAGGHVRSSPLARKLASASGVEIAEVPGTGPNGRVVRRDVEAFTSSGGGRSDAGPRAPRLAPGESKRIPHTRMRRTIADRMLKAKQAAPEIQVTVDIRMDQVLAVRERLNARLAAEKIKLSVGDFVTKAVAMALRRHPAVNASFEPEAIVQHGEINIGIAVALPDGLIVPVLANADQLGLREIRQGTQALAEAARQNKLTPKQMMGSTFTISNLGMYGVKQFDAILNLPEVGILAVGATEACPVVEDGKLAVGQVMSVTLTADHRAVDGATAAEFVRTLKALLEEPAAMLL